MTKRLMPVHNECRQVMLSRFYVIGQRLISLCLKQEDKSA
ncbi:hypothetical protein BH11PSE12_BH11PSE12_06620 [soil metagenome]